MAVKAESGLFVSDWLITGLCLCRSPSQRRSVKVLVYSQGDSDADYPPASLPVPVFSTLCVSYTPPQINDI